MKRHKISRVELYALMNREMPPTRFSEFQKPLYITHNLIRLITEDGMEGVGGTTSYTAYDYDKGIVEAMRNIAPGLIGKDPLMTEALHAWLMKCSTWGGLPARSPVDIAAWDIKGKKAGMPLYMLLGGARDKIKSYASSPMCPTIESYFNYIEACIKHGFIAIKFHGYGVYPKDVDLVNAVQERYETSGIRFMLDVETNYTPQEAMKMARLLESYHWEWFEAPVSDYDDTTYQRLTAETDLNILCHGNDLLTLAETKRALNNHSWSHVRQDASVCGGVTALNKCFAIAEAHHKNLEIQSFGGSVSQAANLHVALAHHNCKYFEQCFPYEIVDMACHPPIRTDNDGFVHAPRGNGLGIEMNWDAVEDASFLRYAID